MAIAVGCECGSQYRVADEMAGKRARCRCGATIAVPLQQAATTNAPERYPAPGAAEAQPLIVSCHSCGRRHQAPAHMAGRAARCSCTAVVQIPHPATSSAYVPPTPSLQPVGAQPFGTTHPGSPNWGMPDAGMASNFAGAPASGGSLLDELSNEDFSRAEAMSRPLAGSKPPVNDAQVLASYGGLERQRKNKDRESSGLFAPERRGLAAGVVGGLLMMLIAAVWFVGGLFAGYIFFYPPVLFVIGFIGLIRGLATGNFFGGNS